MGTVQGTVDGLQVLYRKMAENTSDSTIISVVCVVCMCSCRDRGQTLLGLFWNVYSYFLAAARGDMAPEEKTGWESSTLSDEHRRIVPTNSPLWGDTNIF